MTTDTTAYEVENDELPSARWDRTARALDRVRWQLGTMFLEGYGRIESYKGRHVIGRDRPIVEGVYLGAHEREAIVVSENDGILPRLYAELVARIDGLANPRDEESVITTVHKLVRYYLPKGMAATDAVINEFLPSGDHDRKIGLTVFIERRAGVCRHRALLAGYFIEKLIKDGHLNGRVSVDRSETDEGGHAWARFASGVTGKIFIVDAGLDVHGELFSIEQRWSYRRPDDVEPSKNRVEIIKPRVQEPWLIIDELDWLVAAGVILFAAWKLAWSLFT